MKEKVISVATAICQQQYPDAAVLFVAGSFIRGEATEFSDIDLVVVYELLPNAYRETFRFAGLAIEAFVHDPQTLHYFFSEVDRPSGVAERQLHPAPLSFSAALSLVVPARFRTTDACEGSRVPMNAVQ